MSDGGDLHKDPNDVRLQRQLDHDSFRLQKQLDHDRYLDDREAFRTNERERIKAGYQGATALGTFVLKGLVAVNSGAMITIVALLRRDGNLDASMYTLLTSLMFSLGAAFLGYLQGLAIQDFGANRLVRVDTNDVTEREELDCEATQVSKRIGGYQKGATALALFSAALLVGGIVMAVEEIVAPFART